MYEDEFKVWTKEESKEFCNNEFMGEVMDTRLSKFLAGCQVKVEQIKPVQMNPENDLGILTVHVLLREC